MRLKSISVVIPNLASARGSDKAYFKLFATRGFTVIPAGGRYDFTSLKWIFVIVSVLGLAVLIRLMYRSDGEADRLRPALRRLRQARPRQARENPAEGQEAGAELAQESVQQRWGISIEQRTIATKNPIDPYAALLTEGILLTQRWAVKVYAWSL